MFMYEIKLACTQSECSRIWLTCKFKGLAQIFSVLFSAIFLCRGVTGVCALLLCATLWADTSVCPYGRIANLLCRVFLLLFERQKVNKGAQ